MLSKTYSLIRTESGRVFGCNVYLSIKTNDKNKVVDLEIIKIAYLNRLCNFCYHYVIVFVVNLKHLVIY